MKCTKAIIPVAGYGTRRLPITKAIEKCMLPILNRPIIDYVVEDCIKAGITDIYFVVSGEAKQLRDYYSPQPLIEKFLMVNNKQAMIKLIQPPENITFHYVEQDLANGQYGTTVPVWLCRDYIGADEQVLVLMGDDFVYNTDGSSESRRLVEVAGEHGAAMLGVAVDAHEVSRYGVIAMRDEAGVKVFDHIQEKPNVEEAESNLINVSKYVFPGTFFRFLDEAMQQGPGVSGEYYITDPINAYVRAGEKLAIVESVGEYLDSGSVENWLAANQYVANHPV